MMEGVVDALLNEIREPLINGEISIDSIIGVIRPEGRSVNTGNRHSDNCASHEVSGPFSDGCFVSSC